MPTPCVLLVTLVIAIAGCVPVRFTYYEPAALEGKVTRSMCRGQYGSRNHINFAYQGVKVEYRGDATAPAEHPSLELSLHVPSNITVQIHPYKYKVVSEGNETVLAPIHLFRYRAPSGTPTTIDVIEKSEIGLDETVTLQGDTSGRYIPDQYVLLFTVPISSPNPYKLIPPPLTVNGAIWKFSTIDWHLSHDWQSLAINC